MRRAGPTRCGSSAGERQRRNTNATKIVISTAESTSVSVCLNGSVSEYAVASARNVISIACGRSRWTSVSSSPRVALLAGDARHAPRREEHDQRPPDADEQPVAAGHVRQRERRELVGVLAGLVREREVDRVLGQHRDEREHGEGEALRHVELERLRGPGQQERRAEDGEPEHDRRHDVAHADAADAGQDPGRGGQRSQRRWPGPGPSGPRSATGVLSGAVRRHPPHATGRFPGHSTRRNPPKRAIHEGANNE